MRGILISSVLVTTALYLFVSLLSVSAYPPEYANWLAYFRYLIHRDEKLEYGRHFIVWIVLLVLEVFTRADRILYEQKNALKK